MSETPGHKRKTLKSFALKLLKSVRAEHHVKKEAASPFATTELRNVWVLKFTQDEISCQFNVSQTNLNLGIAVQRITSGDWTVYDFPPMTVIAIGGTLWCLDNRRLWVFRKAVLQMVPVIILSNPRDPRVKEFIARATKADMARWEADNFEPKVRGRVYDFADAAEESTAPDVSASHEHFLDSPGCQNPEGLSWSGFRCLLIGLFVLIAILLRSPNYR